MDSSESIALAHLHSRGFSDVPYEPDGNGPPDFLCDGTVAVEVRRLNQHDLSGRGLEEVAYPMRRKIPALMRTVSASGDRESWFVFYKFRRPLKHWRKLERKIRSALEAFRDNPQDQLSLEVAKHFVLSFARAGRGFDSLFILGGYIDFDSGGWVIAEMIRNINLILVEKTAKVAPFFQLYPEWWLVLIDLIGHNTSEDELAALRAHVAVPTEWAKVILVNPENPVQALEI